MPNTYNEEAQYRKMCELETRLIAIEKKIAALVALLHKSPELEHTYKGYGGTDD